MKENLTEEYILLEIREKVFRTFMEKMDEAEKSLLEDGGYSEEETEAELARI